MNDREKTMVLLSILTIITVIATIIVFLYIYTSFTSPSSTNNTNPFWSVNNTLPNQDRDKLFTPTAPDGNNTVETRYKTPSEIPDCEYLSGKYMFGMQGSTEGMMLGYMVCEGEKPYHYEMILNNVTTRESYWVKREGGSI